VVVRWHAFNTEKYKTTQPRFIMLDFLLEGYSTIRIKLAELVKSLPTPSQFPSHIMVFVSLGRDQATQALHFRASRKTQGTEIVHLDNEVPRRGAFRVLPKGKIV
jgi:hypothetical protein